MGWMHRVASLSGTVALVRVVSTVVRLVAAPLERHALAVVAAELRVQAATAAMLVVVLRAIGVTVAPVCR